MPLCVSYAQYYDEVFPVDEVNLSGGYFISLFCNIDNSMGHCVILIPSNQINNFAFDGGMNLINISSSTIQSRAYSPDFEEWYNIRWLSFGKTQWRTNYTPYTWQDLYVEEIQDMNFYPMGDTVYNNQNLHLSQDTIFLVCTVLFSALGIIIFSRRKEI